MDHRDLDQLTEGDWVRATSSATPTYFQGRLDRITRHFGMTSDWYTVEFVPGAARDAESSAWDNFRRDELIPWQPSDEEETQWLIAALTR